MDKLSGPRAATAKLSCSTSEAFPSRFPHEPNAGSFERMWRFVCMVSSSSACSRKDKQAEEQQMTTAIMTDAMLQRDVMEELKWEPSLDAAHIGVSVKAGVVTLAGHVES